MPPRTAEVNQPVSNHLTKEYYEMMKTLAKPMECSICLEAIDCKNCFCLLICGHSFHYNCISRVKPSKCPICRA